MAKSDALSIYVSTPLDDARDPELTYVISACRQISRHLRAGQLIVLKSRSFPTATRDAMKPNLKKSGLRARVISRGRQRADPRHESLHTRCAVQEGRRSSARESVVRTDGITA
ncbi:hypothetical protein [Allorhodopirellula heiligendammensis]|uniref:hypothetical protein n=1 Tax=Allorhodopirellula heiligendammensis TaxID=2714739 RepID=UPI00345E45C4